MCEDRFRPTRAREIFLLIATLWIFFPPTALCAGLPMANVHCGQQVQGTFTQADQVQEHRIEAESGQTLDIQVAPVGEYLKVWAILVEPNGSTIADSNYQKKVQLQTAQLSAKGLYKVKIYNTSLGPQIEDENRRAWGWGKHETLTGDYVLSVTCVNSDGSWVVEGAKNGLPSLPSGTGSPGPPTAAPPNPLGKYGKQLQEAQATIGGVATTVQTLREIWGAFRPKRQPTQGEPAPVYESPQDLVPRGQQPVYAKPVEAPAPASQDASGVPDPGYQRPESVMGKGKQLAYAQPVETPAAFASKPAAPAQPPPTVDRQAFPLLGLGTVLQGEISASTGAQGCRFEVQAGQGVDLKFERLTGAQGLMITVFAPDQRPVFLTSVLASPKVATTLQLPVAGEYVVEIAAAGPAGDPARFSLQLAAASK